MVKKEMNKIDMVIDLLANIVKQNFEGKKQEVEQNGTYDRSKEKSSDLL